MSCKSLENHGFAANPGTEIITIGVGVGENRQEFKIHKAILQRSTKFFDKALNSEAGRMGLIFLNDDDPTAFAMFSEYLYSGAIIPTAPTSISVRTLPSAAEIQRLEADLRTRFDAHNLKLVALYVLSEKYSLQHLANRTIDAIQDGFHKYGTVFGPGMSLKIFETTKENSKLRDLCVAANVLHMDRGCAQLREEIMMAGLMNPGYLEHLLRWVSRNFALLGRREREGWDNCALDKGFSILNRAKTCSCLFHEHTAGEAHQGHDACLPRCLECGHGHGRDDRMVG